MMRRLGRPNRMPIPAAQTPPSTNAKRIVDNLLSFARYTEHKDAVVDVNKNIDAVMSVVRNTLSINKICVECCKADSLPAVKGDPGELSRCFSISSATPLRL